MSDLNELARRIRTLESQQQFLGVGNSVEDPEFGANSRAMEVLKSFPAVIGVWPMWSTNGAGQVVDVSGNGLHLSRSGTLIDTSIDGSSYFSRAYFSATNSYAEHTDEASFDILGNEAHVAGGIRGMTIGAWIRPVTVSATNNWMAKYANATDRAWWLSGVATSRAQFSISSTGANSFSVQVDGVTDNTWHFVVGRYSPSSALSIAVDNVWNSITTSIPATLFNSSGPFRIGQRGDTFGTSSGLRVLGAFMCAAAVPDSLLTAYYNVSSPWFQNQ